MREMSERQLMMAEEVGKCLIAGCKNPLECYRHIYGTIRYNEMERAEWEV